MINLLKIKAFCLFLVFLYIKIKIKKEGIPMYKKGDKLLLVLEDTEDNQVHEEVIELTEDMKIEDIFEAYMDTLVLDIKKTDRPQEKKIDKKKEKKLLDQGNFIWCQTKGMNQYFIEINIPYVSKIYLEKVLQDEIIDIKEITDGKETEKITDIAMRKKKEKVMCNVCGAVYDKDELPEYAEEGVTKIGCHTCFSNEFVKMP